jgi:hypothetical protein
VDTKTEQTSFGKIPGREECLKVFKRYVLFSNVEEHCVAVTTLAMYLAEKIKEKREPNLNLDLVFAVSLLHDLAKSATVEKLEPEKFGFKPFTEEQIKNWKLLRNLYHSVENLYGDLNSFHQGLNRTVHETDITSIIVGSLFPAFVHYIHQIGGTKNPIYLDAGIEIKIMHYADWRIYKHNVIPFEVRLDYLFDVYWKELSDDQRKARKKREFELEKDVFVGIGLAPDLDVKQLNQQKSVLFEEQYDYFKIEKKSSL